MDVYYLMPAITSAAAAACGLLSSLQVQFQGRVSLPLAAAAFQQGTVQEHNRATVSIT